MTNGARAGRDGDGEEPVEVASPPCLLHELREEAAEGPAPAGEPRDWKAWRRGERERLIAARLAVPAAERLAMSERIAATLDGLLGDLRGRTVALYWPFRGEPDLRAWMARLHEGGAAPALPEVVDKGRPLVFRRWRPGCRMERGVWNIPVPADGETLQPDLVVAPVVGFDPACFRLGYGGGFYDRTLAALYVKPRAVGVGYGLQGIGSLFPRPHDIPLDMVVTETGVAAGRG